MYHLIKKDLLIQKRSLKISILLIIFLSITLESIGSPGLTMGVLAITYQLVLGASAFEDKNNSDIILLSLPIKRTTIVFSKYISIYIFALYAILGFFLIDLFANLLNLPFGIPIDITGVIGSILTITLYFSIIFPLIFKYGFLKAKMLNMILFFIFVFGGAGIINFLSEQDNGKMIQTLIAFFQTKSEFAGMILLLVPLVLLFFCSYRISLSFYQNREF